MRAFSVCFALVLFVTILVGVSGNPVGVENNVALEAAEQPSVSLLDVDNQQGHENEGDRLARQFGGRGGWGGFGRFGRYGGYGRRGGHRG